MRIAVIGGGITGLAAAHRLVELSRERGLDVEVRLLEAGESLGGVIRTEVRDGFVLEKGPDSIITDKPWGLALARRIGLESELIGTSTEHRRSFVVRDRRLQPVPEGFQLLAPSRFGPLASTQIFSWPGKVRMAMDLLIPPRSSAGDESLGSFVLRRLGREALDRMAQPMIGGIYGADPMKLSLQATLPRFLDMEREHGSVIRGMWARARQAAGKTAGPTGTAQSGVSGARYGLFVSFRQGLQTLTDRLVSLLPPGCVTLGARVTSIRRDGDRWVVESVAQAFQPAVAADPGDAQAGKPAPRTVPETLEADGVILALPAHRSAELVEAVDPLLGGMLRAIPYASAATMSLCYRREEVPHPLDGFGFVVPKVEGLTLLGCTFTHVKYAHRAPEGFAALRAFLGEEAMAGRSDAELEQRVRQDLEKLVGVQAEPVFTSTARWDRSMPQYAVGHLDRVAEIETRATALPSFALAGNAYRGVGIPDCVHSGEVAADRLLAHTAQTPAIE